MSRLLDDLVVEDEASQNVDYLSFYWKLEDLWSTRRYLQRRKTQQRCYWRLENAMWRSWAKQHRRLPCYSARSIQWDKDNDITWLYGPWKRSVNFDPSASQMWPVQTNYTRLSTSPQYPHQNELDVYAHQRILPTPDFVPPHMFSKRKTGLPHTGKQSTRVHFSQEVQQYLYLPQDIHWESIFCHQMCNQDGLWTDEQFIYLYLLFKAQELGRSVLPLPPAPLKPIDERQLHLSSGTSFCYELRK